MQISYRNRLANTFNITSTHIENLKFKTKFVYLCKKEIDLKNFNGIYCMIPWYNKNLIYCKASLSSSYREFISLKINKACILYFKYISEIHLYCNLCKYKLLEKVVTTFVLNVSPSPSSWSKSYKRDLKWNIIT